MKSYTRAGVRAYRADKVVVHGRTSWTVVDQRGLPVMPAEEYLHWLRATNSSLNTVRAYSFHLADLFEWLHYRQVAWDAVAFDDLSDFMVTLRNGVAPLEKRDGTGRTDSTVGAVAAAVREFYEYQRDDRSAGPAGLRLTASRLRSSKTSHSFLAHVESRAPVQRNRLAPRRSDHRASVKIINFEDDFELMLREARTARDRLALSAMYDLGLRIGQVLGLRHGDLDVMRKRVRVIRRQDNANGALSKRREDLEVASPARFFDFYRDYYLHELIPRRIESDYLFVNIGRPPVGQPMSHRNLYDQCIAIGKRARIGDVNPHMLRHTHATALAAFGWTSAEIAARLGHTHAASADVYIHLASNHLEKRLAETEHLLRPHPRTGAPV
jgi:integrase/recombinase XerD